MILIERASSSKEESQYDKFDDLGICTTCNSLGSCSLRSNRRQKIVHCEEFDDRNESNEPPQSPVEGSEPEEDQLEQEPVNSRLRGLCVNCARASECTFPRPEGGVWHCEEYE